jgi:hypothetical protein
MGNQFDVNPPEPTGAWIAHGYDLWALAVIVGIVILFTIWSERRKTDAQQEEDFCRDLPKHRLTMAVGPFMHYRQECINKGYWDD